MLSEHFSLEEIIKSQTASRLGLNNTPTEEQINKLQYLCNNILEPLRRAFNKPIIITSGFRSECLCEAIGSSKNSQHAKGEAVDLEIIGVSNKKVSDWIDNNCDYDQLILEYHTPNEPNSGWVHVSLKEQNNRKQYLFCYKENDKTIYKPIGEYL